MRTRYKFFVGLMTVVAAPFLVGGIALQYLAVQKAFDGSGLSVLSYMILGLALVAIGAAIPMLSLRSARSGDRFDELRDRYPAEPWLWRDDWRKKLIRSGSEFPSGPLCVSLLWNGAMIGLGLLLYKQWLVETDPFKWSVVLLPVVGTATAVYAAKAILQWKRFGESRFVLAAVPVPAGGLVEGIIYTNIKSSDAPQHGFKVSLACFNEKVRIERMARTTRTYLLWRDERRFRAVNHLEDQDRLVIPLYFRLPEDCSETSLQTNNRVTWKLKVEGKTGRGEYVSTFTLPVFIDRNEDDRLVDWADCPSQLPTRYAPSPVEKVPEIIGTGIEVDATVTDETSIHLARGRNRMLASLVGFVTVIWWAMTALLFVREAPVYFSALCAAGGILAVYGTIVLHTFESFVKVTPEALDFRRGPFGRGKSQSVPVNEIRKVEVETGSRTGAGYLHNIVLQYKDGSHSTVADLIYERSAADWLALKINTELFGVGVAYPGEKRRPVRRDRQAKRRLTHLSQTVNQRISTTGPG